MHAFTSNWVIVASSWPGVQACACLRSSVQVWWAIISGAGVYCACAYVGGATLSVDLFTRWIYELNIFHWWWFLSLPAAAMVRLPTLYILVCLYFDLFSNMFSLCSYCIVLCWDTKHTHGFLSSCIAS